MSKPLPMTPNTVPRRLIKHKIVDVKTNICLGFKENLPILATHLSLRVNKIKIDIKGRKSLKFEKKELRSVAYQKLRESDNFIILELQFTETYVFLIHLNLPLTLKQILEVIQAKQPFVDDINVKTKSFEDQIRIWRNIGRYMEKYFEYKKINNTKQKVIESIVQLPVNNNLITSQQEVEKLEIKKEENKINDAWTKIFEEQDVHTVQRQERNNDFQPIAKRENLKDVNKEKEEEIDLEKDVVIETKKKKEQIAIDLEKDECIGKEKPIILEDDGNSIKETEVYFYESDGKDYTLEMSDLEVLNGIEMINDGIIDFYMKYIEDKEMDQKYKGKMLFMSPFFLNKLQSYFSLQEYQSEHQNIKREELLEKWRQLQSWLKGKNIFEYNYIFLPFHQNSHFSLIVICFDKTSGFSDLNEIDTKQSLEEAPCYISIDSLHSEFMEDRLKTEINLFIEEEYFKNYKECIDASDIMKEYKINTVKQKNCVDCGCYMLYYIRKIASQPKRTLKEFQNVFNEKEAEEERKRIGQIISGLNKKQI
ncbi:sentrin/sumo-specific protease, putative [Entamoeba dispar SAW760]|uniref:Sentrin/sumo-specific protease, putative n=1 Tax=Entamoeba dispar (strain ATCC PRA-260 / SAW760) TaxID=370354 RepID=B0EAN8_ENTDS|nr:sentrin/sumo-specific protease, putative [Entamoeba dispar SAW760]EDR28410.1 sentrin/sumo-specific protease, putative [Entamoeba dispar SAW760]|eukprot:EDR28410.1 sentrin/sumo-specific protease, putative [Entamoeba dispar SAW760]